jgi:hypothetical protein
LLASIQRIKYGYISDLHDIVAASFIGSHLPQQRKRRSDI